VLLCRTTVVHYSERDRAAEIITHPQHELPVLGPRLKLVVLTDLDKDLVATGLQRALANVLIHAQPLMILLAAEHLPAIEEDLDCRVAAGAELHPLLARRVDDRPGIGDGVLP